MDDDMILLSAALEDVPEFLIEYAVEVAEELEEVGAFPTTVGELAFVLGSVAHRAYLTGVEDQFHEGDE